MSAPIGQRFSQVYLEKGLRAIDSERLRRRLATKLTELCGHPSVVSEFGKDLVSEVGVQLDQFYNVRDVVLKGELRDVLDTITQFYKFLGRRYQDAITMARNHRTPLDLIVSEQKGWREFVGRALQEENVGYRLDDKCGVHYFVDEEFERNRFTTIAALAPAIFANARAAYDAAFRHLDSSPRDTKASVRSMFEATEILAKQICPESKNLSRWLAENSLKERCIARLPGDATEKLALAELFSSFARWVEAIHLYRHGQTGPEPVAPTDELAVHLLSTGSAYVRLLATALTHGGDNNNFGPITRTT